MASSGLTPLQRRVLELLADANPRWTLSGGGALVGFHLRHRTTRDLDLFWQGQVDLGALRKWVTSKLQDAGLLVTPLQTTSAFVRLQVNARGESVVLDMIVQPLPPTEPPEEIALGEVAIQVDTAHEILVNKLGALLGRAELRDLVDVKALLEEGGDLERALRDVPRKDAGFSVPTLAWVLRGLPLEMMAKVHGLDEEQRSSLECFRADLTRRLVELARPDE